MLSSLIDVVEYVINGILSSSELLIARWLSQRVLFCLIVNFV